MEVVSEWSHEGCFRLQSKAFPVGEKTPCTLDSHSLGAALLLAVEMCDGVIRRRRA